MVQHREWNARSFLRHLTPALWIAFPDKHGLGLASAEVETTTMRLTLIG